MPQIKTAYEAKDQATFSRLTAQWFRCMKLQDALLETNKFFLLGRWLSYVPPWASSPAERDCLNYDARSILTTWGDRKASEAGLHEYANRDWAGLISDYSLPRWRMCFESLFTSLTRNEPAKPIDWYAFGDRWDHSQRQFTATPQGDTYAAALAIDGELHLAPADTTATHPAAAMEIKR